MEKLNFFNHFKDLDTDHEDVLSKNFLTLLKNVPTVQIAFFELIRSSLPGVELESIALGKLTVSEVDTQISSGGRLKELQGYRILSIIISDEKYTGNHVVKPSSRKARYDGIIICDPSWIFIIENKPYIGNVWEEQLDPNTDDVEGNDLIEDYCGLSWREIIEVLSSIVVKDNISILEKSIIEDFLEYVDETYTWLNPYNRFGLCKDNKWLIDRRCRDILTEIFPQKEIKYHKGWKSFIDTSSEDSVVLRTALDYTNEAIVLWMYAGETMNAARSLYNKVNVDIVKILISEDYIIEPNFHISYQRRDLVWFSTPKNTLEYIDYWKSNDINQVKRDELLTYCEELARNQIILLDSDKITSNITLKQSPLNICPGLRFAFKWPMDIAKDEDKKDAFVEDCKYRISQIRSIYGMDSIGGSIG